MILTRTISTAIEKGFRIIKTKWANNIVETSDNVSSFGIESNPPKGLVAIISETSGNEAPVILGYLNSAALDSLGIGDNVLYSTDSDGVKQATITLRNDGTSEMLGTGDFMVRFSGLESAYNELNDKYNDLVQKWNAFALAYVPGGPATQGLPPTVLTGSPSTGDISPAKIEEIKTI